MEASDQLHTVADLRTRKVWQYALNMRLCVLQNRYGNSGQPNSQFSMQESQPGFIFAYLVTKCFKLLIHYKIICHPHAYLKSLLVSALHHECPTSIPGQILRYNIFLLQIFFSIFAFIFASQFKTFVFSSACPHVSLSLTWNEFS